MPWNVTKSSRCPADKPWAVIGGKDGKHIAGCHPDRDSALQQQKALYVNEVKTDAADVVEVSLPVTLAGPD